MPGLSVAELMVAAGEVVAAAPPGTPAVALATPPATPWVDLGYVDDDGRDPERLAERDKRGRVAVGRPRVGAHHRDRAHVRVQPHAVQPRRAGVRVRRRHDHAGADRGRHVRARCPWGVRAAHAVEQRRRRHVPVLVATRQGHRRRVGRSSRARRRRRSAPRTPARPRAARTRGTTRATPRRSPALS